MKISNDKIEESLLTSRAVVGIPQDNAPQKVLREALALLGPCGERWCQGAISKTTGVLWWRRERYCALGAALHVNRGNPYFVNWHKYLKRAADGDIVYFNNARGRKFPEIRDWFERAITLASTHP